MRYAVITILLLSTASNCFPEVSVETPAESSVPSPALLAKWKSLAGKSCWKEYPGNPIIRPGDWDSWAVMSMSVVKTGNTFHLYYEGGATGVSDLQIGHVTSTDGLNWVKDPQNPVLGPGKPGEWDDGGVWDPYVIYEDGLFKMWYGGERIGHKSFQCGYAVSTDGRNFVKKGKLSNFDKENIADIHVFHDKDSGRYYLYYWNWGRGFDGAERLRLVTSDNETGFDFEKSVPIHIEGEEPWHQYTQVFREADTWYMFYGYEKKARAGYATSSDGLHWKAQNTNLPGTEDAEVLKVAENLYFMFYCPEGFQDEAKCDIRLAIYNGDLDDLSKIGK